MKKIILLLLILFNLPFLVGQERWVCSGEFIDDSEISCFGKNQNLKISDFSQLGENFTAEVTFNVGKLDVRSRNSFITGVGIYDFQSMLMKVEGTIKGLSFNGKGKLIHLDGDLKATEYEGNFENNLMSGEGTYFYANGGKKTGEKFIGTFKDDGPVKGVSTGFGDTYEGEFNNKTWQLEGYGIYTYANGDRYEGEYLAGKQNGYGKVFFSSGDYAEGMFKNDKMNGPGEYHFKEVPGCESHCLVKNVGIMRDGQISGIGTSYTETGAIGYQGEFLNSLQHGRGIAYDESGFAFYHGEFFQGEITGKGINYFKDGSYFEGEFENSYWHGRGVQFVKEYGETYVGNYVYGSLEGPGTILTDEYKIEANFEDGLLQGKGKTIYPDGTVVFAEYDKGEIISQLDDSLIPEVSTKRVALVIGNNNYFNGPLENAVNDSEGIKNSLENSGFEVIHVTNATKKDFYNALWEFRDKIKQLGTNSSVASLFYYAGHASQVDGINFLNPVDTLIRDESDLELESINARKILNILDTNREGIKIMILDACRNNPFKSFSRSSDLGLAQMDAPSGTFIAYSTSPGKIALDGSAGNYSFYTGSLISNIAIPGMTIEEVFKNTRRDVVRLTSREQIPWEASSLLGDFYFQKN